MLVMHISNNMRKILCRNAALVLSGLCAQLKCAVSPFKVFNYFVLILSQWALDSRYKIAFHMCISVFSTNISFHFELGLTLQYEISTITTTVNCSKFLYVTNFRIN